MPKPVTTWPRESARLAYFAVAMAERKDEALLGLFEQANNALEAYLTTSQVAPPALFAPGPPPQGPLPQPPTARRAARPLSIQAPPEPAPEVAASKPPFRPRPMPALGVDAELLPSAELRRQYCLAFAAVEMHLSAHHDRHLALFDVCSGQSIAASARERGVGEGELKEAVARLKAQGPKAYLDAACGVI